MNRDGKLILALPSKGRLQENANAFFARAGLKVQRSGADRVYVGRLGGVADAEVAFLSASEIAGALESGAAHLGVTGEDLLRETIADTEAAVEMITPLGFGHADVVVAVPQSWIDVRAMADFDDVAQRFYQRHGRRMRVATKYINLTRGFFADHGIADYRIVESLGATEGAPAAGAAEIIVDITSTGATLAANNLKVVSDGVILRSQAQLVASLRADWSEPALGALAHILDMVAAQRRASEVREVRFLHDLLDEALLETLVSDYGCTIPYPYDMDGGRVAMVVHVPVANLHGVAGLLHARGKETVTVSSADYVFEAENALLKRTRSRLGLA